MKPFKGISARAVAGFACQQGFIYSLFYIGDNRAVAIGGMSLERFDLLSTFAFMAVAFIIALIASDRARRALLAPTLVGWYAVLLVLGSLLVTLPMDAGITEIVSEGALVGLSTGFLLCAWGRALVGAPRFAGAREILLATALGAAASFAASALPIPGAVEVLKLLPIGSAWALRSLLSKQNNDSLPSSNTAEITGTESEADAITLSSLLASPQERSATKRLSIKIVAGTALFGLAGGLMEVFSSEPGMLSTPALPATLMIVVLFCVAAAQVLAAEADGESGSSRAENSFSGVYRTSVLLIMAGYLFVPVLGGFGITGQAIVLAGYLGLTCVLMMLFATIARASGQDAACVFARGLFALFIGEIAGILLGNVLEVAQPSATQPYVVAACAGLASLFAYLFLFTERDYEELTSIAGGIDLFGRACETITQKYGLSKRVAEVLPLALRGRTSERIASELYIAKSTADTHLRRIYSKAGVHGRQELIDLGERLQHDLSHGDRG